MTGVHPAISHPETAFPQSREIEKKKRESSISGTAAIGSAWRATLLSRRFALALAKACSLLFICFAATACSDKQQPHKPTVEPKEHQTPGAEAAVDH